eukprot:COSAG05_NODE_4692_length_1407_cov_1.705657_1_plen_181_part_10
MAKKDKKDKKGKNDKNEKQGKKKKEEEGEEEEMDNPLATATDEPREKNLWDSPPAENGSGESELETDDEQDPMELQQELQYWKGQVELKEQKLQRLEGMNSMKDDAKMKQYEVTVQRLDEEVDELRRALFVESKSHPSAKVRKKTAKVRKGIAKKDEVHVSPNTVRTIQDLSPRGDFERGA